MVYNSDHSQISDPIGVDWRTNLNVGWDTYHLSIAEKELGADDDRRCDRVRHRRHRGDGAE